MAFANRIAIIAGGLGGLGSVTGRLLHSQGARIAALYAPFEAQRHDELLDRGYKDELKSNTVHTFECDITDHKSVSSAFSKLHKELIAPDPMAAFPNMLVNSAGYVALSNMEDTSPEDTVKHLHANILGPMLVSQAFARMYMSLAQAQGGKEHVPGGRIVSISSQAAHTALYRHGAYCASKAGLLGLNRSMASEWAPKGITANTVSPTVAWTEMGKIAWGQKDVREAFLKTIPVGRFAVPEDIAAAVSYLCSDDAGMVNGCDLRVDGGFTIQ